MSRGGRAGSSLLAAILLLGACGGLTPLRAPCEETTPHIPLPEPLVESSGIVESRAHPGVFWSHNDSGGEPVLYAFDGDGQPLGAVRVTAARNIDWEDLAIGRCAAGPGGPRQEGESCLFIADTGDNQEQRERVTLYRVPEPEPGAGASEAADAFSMIFPDGPRDVEAIFLPPDGPLHLVTKGRNHPVEIYRYPPASGGGTTAGAAAGGGAAPEGVVLERVQQLGRRSPFMPRHVTGAAASEAGDVVAIRTYETLAFHRLADHPPEGGGSAGAALVPIPGGFTSLRPLREGQGEAVALLPGNRVLLTSEAGPLGHRSAMIMLHCSIPSVHW